MAAKTKPGTEAARANRKEKPKKPAAPKPHKPGDLAPQQERSRESLRKLMKAAAEVLGQHGVEGTTIPRIAAHAGLTPGAIYRRFRDKDALLEAVILGILERQDERARTGLASEIAGRIPLPVFAEQVISALIVGYRTNAPLIRAMRQFVQSRIGTEFWKKVARMERRSYDWTIELFLTNADDIRHPEPRLALSLGLLMIYSTLHEVILNASENSNLKSMLPKNDQALRRELTRAFLAYLEVK